MNCVHKEREEFRDGLCRKCYQKKILAILYAKSDRPNICPYCGNKMINAYDSIEKKMSKYIWKCECKDFPKNLQLCMG